MLALKCLTLLGIHICVNLRVKFLCDGTFRLCWIGFELVVVTADLLNKSVLRHEDGVPQRLENEN